jgi:gamma-glutamyltranspeptidase/glutathione hydrolase
LHVRSSIAVLILLALVAGRPTLAASEGVVPGEGVVATESPLASAAGAGILAAGGSAVDAVIATALAVCTVHPSSCGIGGGGFLVIWDAERAEASALDFRERAPAATREALYEKDGTYIPARSRRGGLAIGVPGEIRGFAAAHTRFGRLPWAALFEPSIALARHGFPVSEHLAKRIETVHEALAADPPLAEIFLDKAGAPLIAGAILRRPALARTFERIAAEGPSAYYEGPIAQAIVQAVAARGGVLTTADLARYEPLWRAPLTTRYRDAEIATMPPPSSGGIALITALDTLSGYDMASLGAASPSRWHLVAEILKHSFAYRAQAAGDPGWDTPVWPPRGRALRDRIRSYETLPADAYRPVAPPPNDSGTAHVSVIAQDGSGAALTTTINTTFGSLVGVPGTGIILNNQIDDFTFDAPNLFGLEPGPTNRIAPGKRPASSMTPTLAIRDGRAVIAVGASGGPLIISATLETLTNVLDYGLSPEAAVAAPRVHHQWMPNVLLVEPGIPEADRNALRILGHKIRQIPGIAAVSLATIEADRSASGAGDPRKGGAATIVPARTQP